MAELVDAARRGDAGAVHTLLTGGVSADASDARGRTALMAAAHSGAIEIVSTLLAGGANVNQASRGGVTALLVACIMGQLSAVRALLQNDAQVDLADANGMTPLIAASASAGNAAVVGELLAHGADVNVINHDGETALLTASQSGDVGIVRALLAHGAQTELTDPKCSSPSPLYFACHYGHLEVVKALVASRAHIHYATNTGLTPLWAAAQRGHAEVVAELLANHAPVDRANNKDATPLLAAAQHGHIDAVTALLRGGADVNRSDAEGVTPLFVAAQNNHLDVVRALVRSGATLHLARKDGMSPLHEASYQGHCNITTELLLAGADTDASDAFGVTPLFFASQEGYLSVVAELLKHGASVERVNANNASPLYIAAHAGHAEIVLVLLEAGAAADRVDSDDVTPLYVASQNGHLDTVQALINHGCQLEARSNEGVTSLYIASQFGHANVVRTLAASGANIEAADSAGATPLFIATQNGHADVVDVLLQSGAQVDTRNCDGLTAMHCTCKQNSERIVASLVAFGASVDSKGPQGVTPLITATLNGRLSTVCALLEAGAQVDKCDSSSTTSLIFASRQGQVDIMQALIKHGANVNWTCSIGTTSLSAAAQQGHQDAIKTLLDHDARVDHADGYGVTPLFIASAFGHSAVVNELLAHGAGVDSSTTVGTTPLIAASRHGHLDIVNTLLKRDAVVTAADNSRCTALHAAAWEGHTEIVKTLLRANATVDAADEHGNTPLICAARLGRSAIVHLLMAAGASIQAANVQNETALTAAAAAGEFDVARALIEADACVNVRPSSGDTCLISAARWENRDLASVLVDIGALTPRRIRDVGGNDVVANAPLMAMTFQALREYVVYMPEFAPMWNSVVQRLEDLYALMARSDDTFKRGIRPLLTLVFVLVKLKAAFELTNTFIRLVMSRIVTIKLRDVHTELTDLQSRVVTQSSSAAQRHVTFAGERKQMIEGFRTAFRDDSVIVTLTFRDEADRIESISLLQNELVARADMHDDDMRELLRESLEAALRISKSSGMAMLPALPTWFIPFHELAVENFNVAVRRAPRVRELLRATWLSSDVLLAEVHDMSGDHFQRSVATWHSMSHPNVVELFGGSHLRRPFVAVFESAKSTNLREYLTAASVETRAALTWHKLLEVALGVKFLHERGIVLGALRCADVWINAYGVARINGFVAEQSMRDPERIRWLAPECMRGESATVQSDIYSLGMCVLEAASGQVPWSSHLAENVDWAVRSASLPAQPSAITPTQWRLVKSMCWGDPTQRASITRVLEQLKRFQAAEAGQHRFIATVTSGMVKPAAIATALTSANIADHVFPAFETTIPKYLKRLSIFVAQCHEHIEDVQHVLARLESIYSWLRLTHKSPDAIGVGAYVDALLDLHGFLRITATNANSVLSRTQSQRVSLRNDVLHRELDKVLQVLEMPAEGDSVHAWSAHVRSIDTVGGSNGDSDDGGDDRNHAVEIIRFEPVNAAPALPPIDLGHKQWLIPIYELKFKRDDPIGTGAFGVVYKGTWFSTPVVIKYMGRADDAHGCHQELFLHELRVWYPLRHPNVARLYGACHEDKRYFVCEFVGNGTLRSLLRRAKHRDRMWHMLHDAALGLKYLHTNNVLHNDLKCDNLLVGDDNKVKIIDFGLSSILNSAEVTVRQKNSGAPRWRSPEYLRGTERLTLASDVYSFGMCILEAVTDAFPWGQMIDAAVRFQVLRKKALPTRPSSMSDSQWSLVRMMCAHEPHDRIDISSVVDRLAVFAEQEAAAAPAP